MVGILKMGMTGLSTGGTMINDILRPFQKQGVEFLAVGNRLLGDEAGVGKTPQLLALTQNETPILVLTMASLKYQFQDEIKKFLPNATSVVIGGTPKERVKQWQGEYQYYIANYELLLRDVALMKEKHWRYILADECTRLSNHTNKQYKALKQLTADFKIPATGTAISNSPLDAYGIFEWIRPGIFGNFFRFSNRYIIKDIWGSAKDFKNMDELANIIAPYYIRRTKEQVLTELPDKVQITVPVELSERERKLYNDLRAELLFDIESADISKIKNITQIQNGVVKMMRLRQMTNSLEIIGDSVESSKLDTLKDLIKTFEPHQKMIIFSEFAEMCKIIHRELVGSEMIIGEVGIEDRRAIVEKFNTDPTTNILVMSSAGAYGLNLQAADKLIHFDLPWSVGKFAQRSARAHRMGQKETVFEYSLIANKTVDQHVLKKLTLKQNLAEMLMPVSELKEMLQ